MPDIITHYIFGLDTAHSIKDSSIYPIIKEQKDLFSIGLQGPDPFYYHKLRQKDSKHIIGTRMHTEKTGDFIISALCYTKKFDINSLQFAQCLSYLSGFICHYILDSMAHPYIFYLGGRYIEGDPETNKFQGLHKQLEIAIDSILYEEKFGKKASHLKIHSTILKDIRLPESLNGLYEDTLLLSYGIHNGGNLFNRSYHDTRAYYKTTYDSSGVKKGLLNVVSPIVSKSISPFVSSFSYFNCVNHNYDYMNRNRQVWLHPVTGNVYTFTFYDILRNAIKKSCSLLLATYDCAIGKISIDDYRASIPNISYLTGLNTSDTRPMTYVSPKYTEINKF